MDQINSLINFLLDLLFTLFAFLMGLFAALDVWLRGLMTEGGVPQGLQSLILIVLGVLFLILVLRYLGGFVRVVLGLLLILLLLHLLLPALGHPPPTTPL